MTTPPDDAARECNYWVCQHTPRHLSGMVAQPKGEEHRECYVFHACEFTARIAALEKERDELIVDGRNLVAANDYLASQLQAAREALKIHTARCYYTQCDFGASEDECEGKALSVSPEVKP